MALRHSNTVAGAALTLAGGVATLLSMQIAPSPSANTLPPSFFPLLCAGGIVLLGIGLLVQGLRSVPEQLPALFDRRVLGVGALMLVYFLSFEYVDFRLGSWLFSLLTMLVMGNRRILQLIVVPLAVTAGVYVTFRYIFIIVLPTWM